MIKRDSYFMIGQHNQDYVEYFDMGDSARSTGLMAMSGSLLDKSLMESFIINGKLVRHPYQTSNGKDPSSPDFRNWALPSETSRDQVLSYSGGVDGSMPRAKAAMLAYAQGYRVNADILLPHHKLSLYKAAGARVPLLTEVFGRVFLFLHIIHLCFFTAPETEVNQTLAMLSRFRNPWMKMFNYLHYDLEKSIMGYWSGVPFRDQKEIGEVIVRYVRGKCG